MSNISVKNLTKKYGSGENQVNALNNVNLTFEDSGLYAVIGASGSGKSTLLHLVGGLDFPTEGQVFYDDRDIYSLGDSGLSELRLKNIGFVFQFFNLIPELTAYENIVLPILLDGKKPDDSRIKKITDLLNITSRLTHLPSQLSGGQQQRTAIARALANDPKVILCDEPTGNLDAKSGADVIEMLKQVNREFKKTIIIITHDKAVAAQCDKVIEISDGNIVNRD